MLNSDAGADYHAYSDPDYTGPGFDPTKVLSTTKPNGQKS